MQSWLTEGEAGQAGQAGHILTAPRNELLVEISRQNVPFKFVHIPAIDGALNLRA